MKPQNFKAINAGALAAIDRVLAQWLPDGRRKGREYIVRNPTRDDEKAGSFSVNLDTGKWADFATNDKGGDLISLVAYLERVSQSKAKTRLDEFLGLDSGKSAKTVKASAGQSWHPICPIPNDAAKRPAAHVTHGKPSAQWLYKDGHGDALCYVCRFDPKREGARKQFAPLTYCAGPRGVRAWRWQALAAPRPLYNLDQLAARPDAGVIVTEGEKAADAAGTLFPARVSTTMLNGAQGPEKADWTRLAGRDVFLWPDNDTAGRKCMVAVANLARAAGAATIATIRIAAFGQRPERNADQIACFGAQCTLPEKWDAADAIKDGWTAEHVSLLAGSGSLTESAERRNNEHTGTRSLSHFELRDEGVYFYGADNQGNPHQPKRIASLIEILYRTRDPDGRNWGLYLRVRDYEGTDKNWCMPSDMLGGDCAELTRELRYLGADVAPGAAGQKRIGEYLSTFGGTEIKLARCTDRTGWYKKVFVLPHRIIGSAAEPVFYQSAASSLNPYKERATLDLWRLEIALPCAGNSRLVFAVSCAFAAPLLRLVDMEGGGFHYRGVSSTGKTTALRAAASVWGGPDYMQPLRATDNGMEARAALHSHTLLVADEIGQADPTAIGDMIYMLGNGYGKGRMSRTTALRRPPEWLLLYLTSGEVGLSEIMALANRKPRAGQEIRLLDIPADAGEGHGIFETLHGADGGAMLSRQLTEAVAKAYGSAGPAFVECVVTRMDSIVDEIRAGLRDFAATHVQKGDSGQVERAALRFALVAIAGELATNFEITGWEKGEAWRAAEKCFAAWLDARGGAGSSEDAAIFAQVREFFQRHSVSRFVEWDRARDDHAPRTQNAAGYRRMDPETELYRYYVHPEVFRSEIVKGHDHKRAERLLVEQGWIQSSSDGRATRNERLPGEGQSRVYVFTPKLWGGDNDSGEATAADTTPQ
jgi:uncharacterized protein (DUF927 family)